MSAKFPQKLMIGPTQTLDPGESLDRLDKLNDDYPVAYSDYKSVLPDMTRMVKMENAIYRVNVPGYFYRHIKNPAVTGSVRSGVVLGYDPSEIDTDYVLSYKQLTKDTSSDAHVQSYVSLMVYGYDAYKSNPLKAYMHSTGEEILDEIGINKWDSKEKMMMNPVCVYPQIRRADENIRTNRINYLVSTGTSGGGHGNVMVPIVPGIGSLDAESRWALVCMNYAKYGPGDNKCISGKSMYQGQGTFVYYYHPDTTDTDEYFFVPCKYVGTEVYPLTKIRDCGSYRYGYNIPTSGSKVNSEENPIKVLCQYSGLKYYELPQKNFTQALYEFSHHSHPYCGCWTECFQNQNSDVPSIITHGTWVQDYNSLPGLHDKDPYGGNKNMYFWNHLKCLTVFDPTVDGA